MRVYVPATSAGLAELLATGRLGPAPIDAVAVTTSLRHWVGEDDDEELEYVASAEAALASLRLLAADPAAARRRVVLAVDAPDDAVDAVDTDDGEGSPGAVRVRVELPLARVASVHVDDADAEQAVAAAAEAVGAADAGDEQAQQRVDAADDFALSWYVNQELADLLRQL